eukprot:11744091-Prorocentrum_lima.AAC.1
MQIIQKWTVDGGRQDDSTVIARVNCMALSTISFGMGDGLVMEDGGKGHMGLDSLGTTPKVAVNHGKL